MINKYAKQSIETMMRLHNAEELPPKGRFHYHQGVFLSGVYKNYLLSGNEEYFNYIKTYVDAMMDEDGNIYDYNKGQMDDIQPGILLFPLYEKTGDAKYKKALDRLINDMDNYPKTEEGGFFHKEWHPNEMWLDGLYMGITTDAINVSVDCAIEELSVLTGEKATETIVNEVFKNFCVGK